MVVDAGAAAGAADAGPAVFEIVVANVEGAVEVQRGKGAWEKVSAGARLHADDAVRTLPGGSVELQAAGAVVRLNESTDVRVAELTEGLTRYLLGRGFVAADAHDDKKRGKVLQVDVDGSDVAVKAADARFSMTSNGEGTVAVAAKDGDVRVASRGKEVVLHRGQRTLVLPEKPPSDPAPLATSLLLKVAWPTEHETNHKVVTVAGRTEAGALVFAMGRPQKVDADGRFRAQVSLSEGANTLDVVAVDASGNLAKAGGQHVVVDTRGAASHFKTDDLWKSPPK